MPRGGHKYGVARAEDRTLDGVVYDSKAEMVRAQELALLLRTGEVLEVRRQQGYTLGDLTYVADFLVQDKNGEWYAEEVKGCPTPMWVLKKRLWRTYGPHPLKVLTGKPPNWAVEWVPGGGQ